MARTGRIYRQELEQEERWVASHVFRVGYPLVITGSGSGDKTFDWGRLFDRRDFLLVNRGFHWVQEYPFHR